MEINNFVRLRPFLYHITDEMNLQNIVEEGQLLSTVSIANSVGLADRQTFLRTRRKGHKIIRSQDKSYSIRDQDPLFENIVIKNLEEGWSFGDFVYYLNSRVFFWATEKDLRTHYKRYENQGEFPIILRFATADLFAVNNHQPKFCRLNSGAPRCSFYYPEGAPPRGSNTFLPASEYEGTPSSIREVTFENFCNLPDEFFTSKHPDRQFRKYPLD